MRNGPIQPREVVYPDIELPWLQGVRGLSFESDISKRASKCRKCKNLIPPGSQRRALTFNHTYKQMGKGGSNKTKMYFHKECLSLDGEERDQRTCRNCNGPKPAQMHVTGTGMCVLCLLTPRLRSCHYCDTWSDISTLSIVREEDADPYGWGSDPQYVKPESEYFACEGCERHMLLVTDRTIARRERKERAIMASVRAMKRDIESWDYERKESQ